MNIELNNEGYEQVWIGDTLDSNGCVMLGLNNDPGVCDSQVIQINKDEAKKIVDHLVKVFGLDK